jgi:hypothetical protein
MPIGAVHVRPRIVVRVSGAPAPVSSRGRSRGGAKAAVFAASVSSSPAPPAMKSQTGGSIRTRASIS